MADTMGYPWYDTTTDWAKSHILAKMETGRVHLWQFPIVSWKTN